MWKDRLSGHPTSSGVPSPRHRSQSPGVRAPSHLAPYQRPTFSPRSSSLSLISNASTSSGPLTAPRQNGSTVDHGPVKGALDDDADPLSVLGRILRVPSDGLDKRSTAASTLSGEGSRRRKFAIPARADLARLSLRAYAAAGRGAPSQTKDGHGYEARSTEEYEKDNAAFEELHRSIIGCDDVLNSVEHYLSNFQADLGVVSAQIEHLQGRSADINRRLENRVAVENILGPTVEQLSISPAVVKKISDGPVDASWTLALAEVEEHFRITDAMSKQANEVKALEDISPLLTNLINKAVEMIRDYLVSQIRALRSPNVNVQIIQQNSLLQFKDLYKFLARHNLRLAEEINQAYIYTMRWYYLHHFTKYVQSLERVKLHVVQKHDLLAPNDRKTSRELGVSYDALTLGNRKGVLRLAGQPALPAYVAEQSSSTHYLDMPFRNFNLALMDNASVEYTFLTEFLSPHSFQQVSRKFTEIFGPTFELGQRLTKSLIENNVDCLSVLLCIRLNQSFAFELQRRKIPGLDSYINGTNMLLWPRFQVIMDLHCESVRKATTMVPGRASAALSLTSADASKQSAAPHVLTQRFGQLLQSILSLSGEAGDDGPIASGLGRLRGDFEAFLMRLSRNLADGNKRERFLLNNYSLITAIISDTTGKLAEEQKMYFEKLKQSLGTTAAAA